MATSTASSPVSTPSFATSSPTKIALYYFNQREDAKLPINQQINIDSLQPVYRVVSPSQNIVFDTISALLQGGLSAIEKSSGFVTDFPKTEFRLLSANLQEDGTLVLEFTEVPGFTSGGSARMLLLSSSIAKTAMQFPGVKKVQFMPESLFQP
ncbi:MAG: GerMN domain-containing protein [bacterium]